MSKLTSLEEAVFAAVRAHQYAYCSTSLVCKELGLMSRARGYQALRSLEAKGLVEGYWLHNRHIRYWRTLEAIQKSVGGGE